VYTPILEHTRMDVALLPVAEEKRISVKFSLSEY
jgi:hypothetical protein